MSDNDTEALSPLKRAIVEIRELKARVAAADRRDHEPIAIVGMGVRLPGGVVDPDSYWQLLRDGVDAIEEVPADRWSVDALYDADPDAAGKMTTRWGGFLHDVDRFDAEFFGISAREAESIDPQQRLLLEVTWEALEHAGIAADTLFDTSAGVFIGISNSDYARVLLSDPGEIDAYATTGSTPSIAAGRISYVLGTHGPAIAVDTACSSSLVSVHMAVRSLRSGECDLALAGGVGLILTPELSINFSRARMMAGDGRCKTFDAAADGYVRSEGCGVVVLKRLSDAVAAGDTVLAVVQGSALNQDGRSGGLTAPNGPAQERVIAAALADSAVSGADVSYVEAHGTGTPLGDPIEVRALGSALCRDRSATRPLALGSVKTNLGHTETAAGIASLMKVVLMLQHREIPPHLNLSELNPHIAAEVLPIVVPTELTPWRADGRLIAGVSSFGLSGTNAHLIVAEAPPSPTQASAIPAAPETADTTDERPLQVLTLSARTPEAVRELADRYAEHLAQHPEQQLADIAHSAHSGRAQLRHRLAVVAPDSATARTKLEAGDVVTGIANQSAPDVAFVFTGHGSHQFGVGRDLYTSSAVFRAAIERCDALLSGTLDRSLVAILFDEPGLLDRMTYAQPALFALQHALVKLWTSWGVRPAVVAGHSGGEYAAATLAGTLSLADGLRLVAERGRLMDTLADDGEMVALFIDEARVAAAIVPHSHDVSIAAVNGPTTTVISGRRAAVQAVITDLGLDDDELRRLDIGVAAHSPLVDPILDDFARAVATASLQTPKITLISSMTGAVETDRLTDVDYWRSHLRQPVRFAAVFDAMRTAGVSTFVEIGPHPTLLALGQRCWPDDSATWAPSLRRDGDGWTEMATGLAMLHTRGVDVDWQTFDQAPQRRRVALPTYAWQRERHWTTRLGRAATRVEAAWPAALAAAQAQARSGPLDLQIDAYASRWEHLERLATISIAAALRDLGLFTTPGERHSVDEVIATGRVLPTYDHLLGRWFEHLAEDGVLQRVDAGAYTAPAPLAVLSLPVDLTAEFAAVQSEFDEMTPLLTYVQRCCERLATVVSGEENALATLFPDGSYETVDFLYNGWAAARYINGIISAAATAAASARAGQTLRVLEVGAGTGGTASTLLPSLPAERTSYTFTDVSDFFLTRAAERFAAYPFVRYGLLDLQREPAEQGYGAGAYDVVVAANVLHATRDLDATLHHALELLAPGGILLAYETTHHPRWLDVTTGLIEGWQLFEDDWRGDHPLLTADVWAEAMRAAGFVDVATLPGDDLPTAILGQHLLMARAPGEAVDGRASDHVDSAAVLGGAVVQRQAEPSGRVLAELAEALPDERHDVMVAFVRRSIAHVLRSPDPDRLQRDQPLLDLGFDSLMAVELRNVLRQGLELSGKLPATLVFDHPNIAAIATHLEHLVADDVSDDESGAHGAVPVDPVSATAATSAAAIADLSDAEVEAMLLKKLAEI